MRTRIVGATMVLLLSTGAFGAVAVSGTRTVLQFGAVADGKTLATGAIQAAIDEAAAQGGGEVVFPPGQYLTGTLYLKDKVSLRLLLGATVLGSTNIADYPVNHCAYASYSDSYTARALIWGDGLHDIAITGQGTIDGQGVAFDGKEATPQDLERITEILDQEKRIAPLKNYFLRPYLIRFVSCRNVQVEGVSLRNSAMWMQHYLDCDFVTLRGLNVFNHGSRNNDMIDIDGCRNVIVSDCFGDSDDDALTLKSTGERPTEHVVVTNCVLRSHCNAIKAGTESTGGFKDITISNCVVQRSAVQPGRAGRPEGLAGIALEIVDGGTMERVAISNIVVEGTRAPIFLRLGNRARPHRLGIPTPPAGSMRNVSIDNVVATGASPLGCAIAGLPGHCIENVSLSNIRIQFEGPVPADIPAEVPEQETKYPECGMFGSLPAYGFYARHVRGLRLENLELSSADPGTRPALLAEDVVQLRVDQLHANAHSEAPAQMVLRSVSDALVTGCVAEGARAFLLVEGKSGGIGLLSNDLSRAQTRFRLAPGLPRKTVKEDSNL